MKCHAPAIFIHDYKVLEVRADTSMDDITKNVRTALKSESKNYLYTKFPLLLACLHNIHTYIHKFHATVKTVHTYMHACICRCQKKEVDSGARSMKLSIHSASLSNY